MSTDSHDPSAVPARETPVIDLVRVPHRYVIGVPVLATFDWLSTLVPAAWNDAFAAFSTDGRPFAEVSTSLGAGRYHEVVGLLAEDGDSIDGFTHAVAPAGEYARLLYRGERSRIAAAFGEIEEWIRASGQLVGATKLDIGYRPDGIDEEHELFVSIVDPARD